MSRCATWNALIAWCGLWLLPQVALGAVDLVLESADVTAERGATVEIGLWARSTDPTPIDGVEVSLAWDASDLELNGHDDGTASPWRSSSFPIASPLNDDWADGTALYQATASLSGESPSTDILVTTLRFTAGDLDSTVTVEILDDGNTLVASEGQSALGSVSQVTVTIGNGDGTPDDGSTDGDNGGDTGGDTGGGDIGGGTGDTGGDPGDGDVGDGETGDDGSDPGDDTGDAGTGDDGTGDNSGDDAAVDDGSGDELTSDDGSGAEDDADTGSDDISGGDNGQGDDSTSDEETGDAPVVVPPNCGPGAASVSGICLLGLFLVSGRRHGRRAA